MLLRGMAEARSGGAGRKKFLGGEKTLLLVVLFLGGAEGSLPGQAGKSVEGRAARVPPPRLPWEGTLLGGAGGVRAFLLDLGLRVDPVWTNEVFWNLRGGLKTRHARAHRQDASLYLDWDSEEAGLWDGGHAFVHLQEERGRTLSPRFTGDYQLLSNMEARDLRQVSDAWFRQSFFGGRLWVKAGKQEMSLDYGYSEYAQEFLNSSAAVFPNVPLATFPDPDLGVTLCGSGLDFISVKAGCFQSRPEGGRSPREAFTELRGPFLIAEPAFSYSAWGRKGTLRLGGWFRNDETPRVGGDALSAESCHDSQGGYLVWDQLLWREEGGEGRGDGGALGAFGQYSWAPGRKSAVVHYLGAGLEWRGPFPGRKDDVLGLGCFQVRFSGKTGLERHSETAMELFYKFQVTPWWSWKPDLQYILSPGGRSRPGALALGIRMEVLF